VFSSIDEGGRYAYGNQPQIAQWNLARLAETLLPLLGENEESSLASAQEALGAFGPRFEVAYFGGLRRKIGLFIDGEGDDILARDLLRLMAEQGADFTLTFRALSALAAGEGEAAARALFADPDAFGAWAARWRERLAREPGTADAHCAAMQAVNPAFIPRNHQVQAVIEAAIDRKDFAPFADLVAVLSRPYEDQPGRERYTLPPRPEERVLQTFCGT
jgi:uncharacterized protein YdiU (UPF0061 family)